MASIHFRGGTSRATDFLWEINGTEGDLVVTLDAPHIVQFARATLRGGRTEETTVNELPVPSRSERAPVLAGRQHDVAYTLAHAYSALPRHHQRHDAHARLEHALRLNRLLDHIQRSATSMTSAATNATFESPPIRPR
ncbi:MAG: hypothetical protein JO304_28230 [Solirubrobacterales bacterium]|nr:hypothetical protein [Solirubrobacterales bacterium]